MIHDNTNLGSGKEGFILQRFILKLSLVGEIRELRVVAFLFMQETFCMVRFACNHKQATLWSLSSFEREAQI